MGKDTFQILKSPWNTSQYFWNTLMASLRMCQGAWGFGWIYLGVLSIPSFIVSKWIFLGFVQLLIVVLINMFFCRCFVYQYVFVLNPHKMIRHVCRACAAIMLVAPMSIILIYAIWRSWSFIPWIVFFDYDNCWANLMCRAIFVCSAGA